MLVGEFKRSDPNEKATDDLPLIIVRVTSDFIASP